MKSLALVLAMLICLSVLSTPGFAADGKSVSYKSGDETVNGMLYAPAGKGPFPALIVIHEWWGLNDWVKEQASKFADQGYVALAVDLYRGKVADNPDLAHELMRGVPEDRATATSSLPTTFWRRSPTSRKTASAQSAGAWAAATRSTWPSSNRNWRRP